MKFFHLSDLHLGKRVNEFSMLEDQRCILSQILGMADAEEPDAVLISGDVYDKSVPSAEAVQLFDCFLNELNGRGLTVLVISGNHDSPERIAFGGRLMAKSGVYMSPVYDGHIETVRLWDEYGAVDFWLLPFIKPAHVRRYYGEETIESYTDAVRCALSHTERDAAARQVLLTHQFVVGAERCESEEFSVGGTDGVDASVFDGFDYVALGHLHGPQSVARETVRYCGTPLKYSFSEVAHQKSVTVVELAEKGSVRIRTLPLTPQHDMRCLRGTYMEVTARSFYSGTATDDYLRITLTDEQDIPDAVGKLRSIYPNLMKLDYDNARTRAAGNLTECEAVERRSPIELFAEFYEKQNNRPMDELQRSFSEQRMNTIWEAEE